MQQHYITWWNLENLLHHQAYPKREEWLQKNLANSLLNWTTELLEQKIKNQTTFLQTLNEQTGPSIIGVCEVENLAVLQLFADALNKLLPNRKYGVILYESGDKRGIDLGLIYDTRLYDQVLDEKGKPKTFTYRLTKRNPTRDILHVELKTKLGNHLVLLLNHWSARSPDIYQSKPYRIIAGETLSYWVKRIHEILGKDIPILVMGDFNDEPHDRSLVEFALSSESRQRVMNARTHRLYNLMWEIKGQRQCSYLFNSDKLLIDQFLASKALIKRGAPLQVKEYSVRLEGIGSITKGRYNTPIPFRKKKGVYNSNGYSDHLPISVILNEKPKAT